MALASLRRLVPGPVLLAVAGATVMTLGMETLEGAPAGGSNGVPFQQLQALVTHLDASFETLTTAVNASGEASRPNLGPRTAADLVTIRTSGTPCATAGGAGKVFDLRINASAEGDTFVIPDGKVFVATGISWRSLGNTDIAGLTIRLEAPATLITAYFDTQPVLAGGVGGRSGDIPSFTVAPGVNICMLAGDSVSGNLYGYFADAE